MPQSELGRFLMGLGFGSDEQSLDTHRKGWTPLHTAVRIRTVDEATRSVTIRLLLDA